MLLSAVSLAIVLDARFIRRRRAVAHNRQPLDAVIDGVAANVPIPGPERIPPFDRICLLCSGGGGGRDQRDEECTRAGDDGAAEIHWGRAFLEKLDGFTFPDYGTTETCRYVKVSW